MFCAGGLGIGIDAAAATGPGVWRITSGCGKGARLFTAWLPPMFAVGKLCGILPIVCDGGAIQFDAGAGIDGGANCARDGKEGAEGVTGTCVAARFAATSMRLKALATSSAAPARDAPPPDTLA